MALPTPGLQTSCPQSSENIHFCSSKAPSLWDLVRQPQERNTVRSAGLGWHFRSRFWLPVPRALLQTLESPRAGWGCRRAEGARGRGQGGHGGRPATWDPSPRGTAAQDPGRDQPQLGTRGRTSVPRRGQGTACGPEAHAGCCQDRMCPPAAGAMWEGSRCGQSSSGNRKQT